MSADESITIHRHYHAARPLTVTKENCLTVLGVAPSDLGALLRRLDVPNRGTSKNPIALLDAVEKALRGDRSQHDAPVVSASRDFLRSQGLLEH